MDAVESESGRERVRRREKGEREREMIISFASSCLNL